MTIRVLLRAAAAVLLLAAGCPEQPRRSPDATSPPADRARPLIADASGDGRLLGDGPGPGPDARRREAGSSTPTLTKLHTEHLGQLTGTAQNPLAPLGMAGTDLGASFERDGKLVVLFGDSWTLETSKAYWDQDSAAWTSPATLAAGGALPKLTWYTEGSGRFLTIGVPGVTLDGMNVPVEGVAAGAQTFVFFSAGWNQTSKTHSHSVLAHAGGLSLQSLVLDHSLPSAKFINVSVVVEQGQAWIFGSGPYRKSAVYLARVPLAQLASRTAWSYYQGSTGGTPKLGPGEASAIPIVAESCVGELSVRRHPTLALYLMAYNCDQPRGILLRTAASPAGPWSPAQRIFDPAANQDRGYQHFIHARESVVAHDDGLSEPGREEEWGGEYGPYLVPQWFESTGPGLHRIVYLLSSWNPYQVHLMRTTLGEPGVSYSPPPKGVGLPPASLVNGDFATGDLTGWTGSGDGFGVFVGSDGKHRLTTHVLPRGDAVVGKLWQDFTIDSKTGELSFYVHGGDATVKLVRGGEAVRSSRGRHTNIETLVRWRLEAYRGEKLRVLIEDDLNGEWGFVGARGFSFGP